MSTLDLIDFQSWMRIYLALLIMSLWSELIIIIIIKQWVQQINIFRLLFKCKSEDSQLLFLPVTITKIDK